MRATSVSFCWCRALPSPPPSPLPLPPSSPCSHESRQDNEGNLCVVLLMSCLEFLYALLEAVTKFGVVRAAITGEAFMDACHGVVDILARNLLDTVRGGVEGLIFIGGC